MLDNLDQTYWNIVRTYICFHIYVRIFIKFFHSKKRILNATIIDSWYKGLRTYGKIQIFKVRSVRTIKEKFFKNQYRYVRTKSSNNSICDKKIQILSFSNLSRNYERSNYINMESYVNSFPISNSQILLKQIFKYFWFMNNIFRLKSTTVSYDDRYVTQVNFLNV